MRLTFKIITGLVFLATVAILAIIFIPVQRTGPLTSLAADFKPDAGRGRYLAELADCSACHTAKDGQAYAGGREVASPFGIIYSSNITPDKYGIKGWTLDQFSGALRDGLDNKDRHLYPAMPYENYRKINDADIADLYQYFMTSVTPVSKQVPITDLTFPFNQRWGIRLWNWFAIPGRAGYRPQFNNPLLDRGAYIVEGLAHCGACHTPRNIMFRQAGGDENNRHFLSGETIDGWFGPDLRGAESSVAHWTVVDLKAYLQTGRNKESAAVGPMLLVVGESLQFAKDEDIDAVVAYLKNIALMGKKSPSVRDPALTTQMLTEADPNITIGARTYLDNCNACHFANGRGASEVFPALDGAKIVNADDPKGLVSIILNGSRLPSTHLKPAPLAMPGFGWRLSDQDIAALASFLRSSWTNNAAKVTAEYVGEVRKRTD